MWDDGRIHRIKSEMYAVNIWDGEIKKEISY